MITITHESLASVDRDRSPRGAGNPHGEAQLDPEDYAPIGFFDAQPNPMLALYRPEYLEEIREWKETLRKHSNSAYPAVGRCAHCGQGIRYHIVYSHRPTGAVVAIGQDCARNRMELSTRGWKEFKARLDSMRELAARGEKRAATRERFPEAAEILESYLREEREGREAARKVWEDAGEPTETIAGTEDYWPRLRARFPDFVMDIARRMQRYGSISEKQAAAVVKYTALHRERVAQREAQRAAEKAAAHPIPVFAGRVELEGTILSAQYRETPYGVTPKILLRHDDGWKLWGTMPRSLEEHFSDFDAAQGARVRFVAKVEVSRDDDTFGFFSRPTKAEVVS